MANPPEELLARQRGYNQKYRKENRGRFLRSQRKYQMANPEKVKESSRKYRAANREKILARKRMDRYGISPADFQTMLEVQKDACKICKQSFGEVHIDHCHTTGDVRGLLCGKCNRAIGLFNDSIKNLQAAIEYLS